MLAGDRNEVEGYIKGQHDRIAETIDETWESFKIAEKELYGSNSYFAKVEKGERPGKRSHARGWDSVIEEEEAKWAESSMMRGHVPCSCDKPPAEEPEGDNTGGGSKRKDKGKGKRRS
jgi:hypothetical protein